MLQLFADALLIATRMEPRHTDRRHHRPEPEPEAATRRRWFNLAGLR